MLTTPTLFVVGAGASAELGFPIGTALRDEISLLLDLQFHGVHLVGHDQDFADFLSDWCFRTNVKHHDLWQAANSVSRALPLTSSIDSYLDSHRAHPLRSICGKLAIARAISVAENQSALSCNNDKEAAVFDFKRLSTTWYQRLWSLLQKGVTPEDPKRAFSNLKIITFNYDRSIQRFLQLAYSHFLDVPLDVALNHVDELEILHIYGSLGKLEARPDVSKSFRTNGYTIDLFNAAQRISTYTEQVNSDITDQIGDLIWDSQRIVFMGFSFGSENFDLLSQAVGGREIQRQVYATTYQMSDEATSYVRTRLDSLFSRNFSLASLKPDKAAQFFDRYAGIF